jgi:hypothetical protein
MIEDTTEAQPANDAEAIPPAILARLRRIAHKVHEACSHADKIWKHELHEAAEEIGVQEIAFDLDAGTYSRKKAN